MRVRLAPYPEYKDSSVPWLGEIPKHWSANRLKQVCRLGYGDSLPSEVRLSGDVPVYGSNGCVGYHNAPNTLGPCIIIGRKGSFGKVNYSPQPAFAIDTTFFVDARLTKESLRCLYYVLSWVRLDDASRDSAIPGLDRGEAYERIIPTAPIEEQHQIAAFLDSHDHLINRLIRAKRRLIELLNEQKQAIIHEAVTRGLDPNVRLKPSGIDWLGDVPEHWEVRRAKAVCSAIIDCKNRTPEAYDDGAYTVVRTTCIRDGQFDPSGGYKTNEKNYLVWTTRGAPRAGDGFFTREALAGEACLVPERNDLCMGQRVMYFRPDPELLDAKFLLLNIYGPLTRTYVELATNGSTVGHLRLGQVYALPILWCSLAEQRAIVKHVEEVTQEIDHTHATAQREIELLHEYRTRLIADVVTGKLDVRGAELPALDESDTLEEWETSEDAGVDEMDEMEGVDV